MLLSQRKKAQAQHHVRPRTRQTEEELAFSLLSLSLAPIRVNNYDKKKNRREIERIANHFFYEERKRRDRTNNQSIDLSIYCHS